jgi:hypothetical protein
VATAGERPHIVQGPDDWNLKVAQRAEVQVPGIDPVQIDDVRTHARNLPGTVAWNPVEAEWYTVSCRIQKIDRLQIDNFSQTGEHPGVSMTVVSADTLVVAVGVLNAHCRRHTDALQAGQQAMGRSGRAPHLIECIGHNHPHMLYYLR